MGETETEESPVDIRPAERAGHGWTALDLPVKRNAASELGGASGRNGGFARVQWTLAPLSERQGRRTGGATGTLPRGQLNEDHFGYVAQLVRARHS
jgi:hypothetical protein